MTPGEIWSELGLEPTQDRSAVRRAYARRLKLTNPEDDPEAFKRLRGAYETALVWVEQGGPFDAEAQPTGQGETAPPQPAAPAPPPADPSLAGSPDPFQEHWDRCRALVDRATSGEAADDELLATLDAILKASILEHLEVFQRTGLAFARSLPEISPRGDALVWPILTHFGWRKAQLGWASLPEVEALQELGRRVTDRQSVRESRAYDILTAPPPRKVTRETRWQRDMVMRLIRQARGDEAWVMAELNAESVKWWARFADPKRLLRRRQLIFLAVVLGFIGLIVVAAITEGEPTIPVEQMTVDQLAVAADGAPADAALWSRLCNITARHYWRGTSLNDCDHAAALNPGVVDTQLDRAFLYLKVGDHAHAEEHFGQVLVNWPDSAVAFYGRALARAAQDEIKDGRKDWCRARELDPKVRGKIEATWEFRVEGAFEPC